MDRVLTRLIGVRYINLKSITVSYRTTLLGYRKWSICFVHIPVHPLPARALATFVTCNYLDVATSEIGGEADRLHQGSADPCGRGN
jgi:hypothetical protein